MPQFYIPSLSEISAVAQGLGADSRAPGLWRGLIGAWPLQETGGLKAYDLSGYRRHGTLTNMEAATDHVVTAMGRALDFDGSNEYVSLGNNFNFISSSSLTIAFWEKTVSSSNVAFISKEDGHEPWPGWIVHMGVYDATCLRYEHLGAISGNRLRKIWVPVSAFHDGRWHHIVVTRAGSAAASVHLYIDGKEETYCLEIIDKLGNDDTITDTDCMIGARDWGQYFPGFLTDVGIWSRALRHAEIRSLYTNPWGMYTLRRRVQVRGAAGGGGTLAADAGAFVESGKAVSLLSSRVATAGVGTFVESGKAVSLLSSRVATAGVGTFVESGTASGLLASRKVAAGVGSYIESGTAAGLLASHVVAAALGTYTHAGTSAGLLSSRRVAAGVGSYALAGTAALPLASWLVAAGVGAYLLDGKSASLDYSAVVSKAHIAYVNMRRNLA